MESPECHSEELRSDFADHGELGSVSAGAQTLAHLENRMLVQPPYWPGVLVVSQITGPTNLQCRSEKTLAYRPNVACTAHELRMVSTFF